MYKYVVKLRSYPGDCIVFCPIFGGADIGDRETLSGAVSVFREIAPTNIRWARNISFLWNNNSEDFFNRPHSVKEAEQLFYKQFIEDVSKL